MENLKIGYAYFKSESELDPANIQTIYQSNLIENIYSRIIEYDNDGQIICSLCDKFWMDGKVLNIQFSNNIITKSGDIIGAEDAYISLKRLLDLNSNTHGNLLYFIDGINQITFKENILKINLRKEHFSQFVIPLLTSMDYSIIPKNAISKDNKIVNYQDTTGAYYIEKNSEKGELIFKSNHHNSKYSDEMFHTIAIVPTQNEEAIDKFERNFIDIIDITNYPRSRIYSNFFKKHKDQFNFHKTIPINLFLLIISPDANRDFTREQLFYLLKKIENKYLSFETYGYKFERDVSFLKSIQLTNKEKSELEELRDSKNITKSSRKLKLGVLNKSFTKVKDAFLDCPEIEVISFESDPSFLPLKERPDVVVQTTDSSFNEDFTLLSYNFSMNNFGYSQGDGDKWLNDYTNIPEKNLRLKKIHELELEILKKPSVFPIGFSPYFAISKKDIELNFSNLFPGSTWWKIRKK